MSRLRKAKTPALACECQSKVAAGACNLRIVPVSTDVREASKHNEIQQLAVGERLQGLFFPHLAQVDAHAHGDGYHVHPAVPNRVAHISQLHDELEPHGLAARLSLTPGGDAPAVTAALRREHLTQLVRDGVVDIEVPLDQGTFRLHSTAPGRITAVEYVQ